MTIIATAEAVENNQNETSCLQASVDEPTIERMKPFNEMPLDPAVLKSLENMGYQTMTPIQEMAIPKLLTGQDFLGQAPTGTGKTAAFGVPLISRIQPGTGNVEALILCPTRELAQQIAEELNRIGAVKGVKTIPIYGGESVFAQKDELRKKEHQIVVGTPGRVMDHIRQLTLELANTRMVILDEADEMLDMGFRPDIETIFKSLPGGRETWLFSATISPEIRKIADDYMYYPEEVRIQPQTCTADNIAQFYYIVQDEEKHRLLRNLLKNTPDFYGLIFCQTKRDVVVLARKLRDYFPLDCLHGGMEQYDRDKVMDAFRKRELRALVATDIVARGIDVDSLTHVINFSPPPDPESYIHRIGRTARAGETGTAITLFNSFEQRSLDILEKRVKMAIQLHPDSTGEFDPNPPKSAGRGGRYGSRSSGARSGGGHSRAHSSRSGGHGRPRHAAAHSLGNPPPSPDAAGEGNPDIQKKRRRPRRRKPKGEGGAIQAGSTGSSEAPVNS